MPSPLDVMGTLEAKAVIIVAVVLAVGLVLVFTPLSAVGYILLFAAAILFILFSIHAAL